MTNLGEITVGNIVGGKDIDGTEDSDTFGTPGTRSTVLSFVRQNPEGVSTNMVAHAAEIGERRSLQILNELSLQREIYFRDLAGVKARIWYPNGKLIHKYLQSSREFGSQIFRISFHEGNRAPKIQIQERKFTLLDGEKVDGAIFLDLDNADSLRAFLEEMLERFNQYEETKKLKRR